MELKAKNDVGVLFQKTLPLKLYRNETLIGAFFIETSAKENKDLYKISSTDYIGLLDKEKFLGGMYTAESVGNIVANILEDSPYTIDQTLASRTVTGYICICSKREALQMIIFSAGGIIDCSRNDSIEIKLLPTETTSELTNTEIVSIKETVESITTTIELIEHKYKIKSEAEQIIEDAVNGEALICFNSPYNSISISGGTILQSGINFAKISANGSFTLTGFGYDDITITKSKRNPLTVTTDIKKIKSYSTTLVCNEINLLDQLQFINKTLSVNFKVSNGEKVGDKIQVLNQTARITRLEYELNTSSIYANAEMEVED